MTKPLTKVWTCPTCKVGFKGSEAREDKRVGRRCPDGHFHTYYELRRHEDGKPVNVARRYTKPETVPANRPHVYVDKARQEKIELLAILWISAVDKLLDQLPTRSTSRQLIEGALTMPYKVSQQVISECI